MNQKKHIGIVMPPDHNWIGGIHYTQNLIRAVESLPENEKKKFSLSLVVYNKYNLKYVEPLKDFVNQVIRIPMWEIVFQGIKKRLAKKIPIFDYSFFNIHKFDFIYPFYAGKNAPYSWGAWIPDFQYIHLPHFFSKKSIAHLNSNINKIALHAPVVVLSSQMAQNHFRHQYPEAAARSYVLPFVSCPDASWFTNSPFHVQQKYHLPDCFFLVSNQFWKHKDHRVVVEAINILRREKIYPHVVLTGPTRDYRHPTYFKQLVARIQELGIEKQISILGLIPRIDQVQLMRRSLAIIQPSLFEGWSTVVEDARVLGKPMILSDFPVHIEQDPRDSIYFEQSNAEQLAKRIKDGYLTLKAGPDLVKEAIARKDNEKRMKAFGRRFLKIAIDRI
jgi:glycosyltransferase involved in cell wall biosynthesis